MSKDLTAKNDSYILPTLSEDLSQSITTELEGLPITLDKVKIPAGGGLAFEVPGEDPESPDMEKEIIGVLVDHYPLNSYWLEKYNGQNVAPACYSTDSRHGIGTPGGECMRCPFNKYGSGDDGQSKACKNAHRLYILRSGELYPIVITIPPTSLKPLSDYLAKRIITKGLRSFGVVTKLSLKKAVNATGIAYSQVQFTLVDKLPTEAVGVMAQFSESIKGITRRVDFMEDDILEPQNEDPMVDPETGEVIEPLN